MEEDYLKKYQHAPAHLFITDYYYFITAGTYNKERYFDSDNKKEILFETICRILKMNNSDLLGWVILANHYHIITKLNDAFLLPEIIRKIHSLSAVLLNRLCSRPGRKIWYQYWDECIRNEKDFYSKLNYIHWNPVKHSYVDEPEAYQFSSYKHYLKLQGPAWLNNISKYFSLEEVKKDGEY